jgi:hypothetical protein
VSIDHRHRAGLSTTLGQGPDCVTIERLGRQLSAEDQNHVDGCARCQTEGALWRAFASAVPAPGEGAAVEGIVAELRRHVRPRLKRAPSIWRWVKARQLVSVAAALAIAAAVGYVVRDPEPAVRTVRPNAEIYRTARLNGIAPLGDTNEPPRIIEWAAYGGAAVYDVEVFEVDRSTLWRGSSSATHIALPPSLSVRFVPGKSVLWEVKARNASGVVLAESGSQQFRVSTQRN